MKLCAPMKAMAEREFIVLAALMMSLTALAIDVTLPALPAMPEGFGIAHDNRLQQVISLFFLGITLGQLFYGPLADRAGRRPAFALGMGVFMLGTVLSLVANSFEILLLSRFVQGIGAAAMRIIAVSIMRDLYEGAAMARIMSFSMTIFMIVPCIAPMLGQGILLLADWQMIFWLQLALVVLMACWFWLRQPESLNPQYKVGGSWLHQMWLALRTVITTPAACGYMVASGMVMGSFLGYLVSSQPLFVERYGTGAAFPLYFAGLAICMGMANFLNAQVVERMGMRRLCYLATLSVLVVNLMGMVIAQANGLSLWGFMAVMAGTLFANGFMFGNMNAITLQPLGHMAGAASSVISLIGGLISLLVGSSVGGAFAGDAEPLLTGFALSAATALLVMILADRYTRLQAT